MTEFFFPFTIYGGSAHSNTAITGVPHFSKLFRETKPEYLFFEAGTGIHRWTRKEKFLWYCFDVIIHSPTSIEFVVYDLNRLHGVYYAECSKRGEKIHSFKVEAPKELVKAFLENRAYKRAERRRQNELDAAEALIIEAYASQELADAEKAS